MKTLECGWGTMHLSVAERGRTSLVFVNSLGTDLRMWDSTLANLPSDWTSLRMDKRGHGLSDNAPKGYGIPDLATDVISALDHVGMGSAVIVGCSVGGLIAQQVALMAPQRVDALVLSNTAAVLGAPQSWQARIHDVNQFGMAEMAERIMPRWFAPKMLNHPEAALWRTLLARSDAQGYVATCAAIAGTDLTDRLGEVSQPALVVGGQDDLATPPAVVEMLAHRLPCAELVMLEGVGHLPAIEAPKAFSELIVNFVEGIVR